MAENAASGSELKGVIVRIGVWTAIIIAVAGLVKEANGLVNQADGLVSQVQNFTCRFGIILPWCPLAIVDSKVPANSSAEVVGVCRADLNNARDEKRLNPKVNVSTLESFEKAIKSCAIARKTLDLSKLDAARSAREENEFERAGDLYDQVFDKDPS